MSIWPITAIHTYEFDKGKFPLFYLLHGVADSDNSWTSVERAGFTRDNHLLTPTKINAPLHI